MSNSIIIKGALEHNLKNLDVEIPVNQCVTGLMAGGVGRRSLSE